MYYKEHYDWSVGKIYMTSESDISQMSKQGGGFLRHNI